MHFYKKKNSNKKSIKVGVSSQGERGFTLVEILISIAVLIVISFGIFRVFNSFDENQALQKDAAKVISVLEKARQQTLFSRDSSQYGVHFNINQVVLFKGDFYSSSDEDNVRTTLHSKVNISSKNLSGGGDEVVFERLSGETNQGGTITLQNRLDASKAIVVTIEGTGLIK